MSDSAGGGCQYLSNRLAPVARSRHGLIASGLAIGIAALAPLPSGAAGLINPLGFQGTTQFDNCSLGADQCRRPPDTMGAIGLTQYMETSNGSLTVYDRSTGSVLQRWSSGGAAGFWQSKLGPGFTGSLGDQRILFDLYTNRWIVIGFGSVLSDLNIAISDSADALGSWTGTSFTGFAGGIADYPTLGIDDKGVYIGVNNFSGTPTVFNGASLFVIPRSDLFGGAPTAANRSTFNSTFNTGLPLPANLFTFQGAVDWAGNGDSKAAILATSANAWADAVFLQAENVDAPGATFTPPVRVLTDPAAVENLNGRQPDGTRLVDTLDDRISANVYQANGRLYGVQTVTRTGHDYTQLHWFVLNAASGALIEEGYLGGDNYDYYQGAIAANEWGEAVIGYNRSGGAEHGLDGRISFMAQAFRTDALGGLDPYGESRLLRRSDIDDYRCGSQDSIDLECRQRWGDYAAVTIDPLDSRTFWAIGEYAAEWTVLPNSGVPTPRANWSTYIASLQLEPTPGPLPALGLGSGLLWSRRLRRRIGSASRTPARSA